jgi:hypothetical protein
MVRFGCAMVKPCASRNRGVAGSPNFTEGMTAHLFVARSIAWQTMERLLDPYSGLQGFHRYNAFILQQSLGERRRTNLEKVVFGFFIGDMDNQAR